MAYKWNHPYAETVLAGRAPHCDHCAAALVNALASVNPERSLAESASACALLDCYTCAIERAAYRDRIAKLESMRGRAFAEELAKWRSR